MSYPYKNTSWENSASWYSAHTGEKGHYYHQAIILPNLLRILGAQKGSLSSFLDLGCGPGVLARAIPQTTTYWGVDASPSLIAEAKKTTTHPNAHFSIADITRNFNLNKKDFDCACFILSLQNIDNAGEAISQAFKHLRTNGSLLIVLNHPCFRIPRQSSWQVDSTDKIRYRRINRYNTPFSVPIQTHPGRGVQSPVTTSFHRPLGDYVQLLIQSGFVITGLEEWVSDKKSQGKMAKMEDRSRFEIPLFLSLLAKKTE
jgi:SAM-dependent methyltransferase